MVIVSYRSIDVNVSGYTYLPKLAISNDTNLHS